MSTKTKRIHLSFLLITVALSLAVITLRILALLGHFDAEVGYFTSSTLSIAFTAILVGGAVFGAVFSHELSELFVFTGDYRDVPTLFASAFSATVFLFFSYSLFTKVGGGAPLASLFAILAALCALLSGIGFLLSLFDLSGARRAMFSLFPVGLSIFYAFYLYFEGQMMLNNPNKLLCQAAFLLSAFFFLGESRIALGRAKWALHTYITLLTLLFSASLSLPNLVYHAAVGTPLLFDTMPDFVLLAIFFYTAARAVATLLTVNRQSSPSLCFVTEGREASNEEKEEE